MAEITGTMEWILENIAGLAIVIFEFIGVAIINLERYYRISQVAEARQQYRRVPCKRACHGIGI